MKILTWNINGIRACKIPLEELFRTIESDIVCLQETKVTRDQLDGDIVNVEGYNAYFSFSRKRSGYSGVATYCRNDFTPVAAEEGITGILSSRNKQTTHLIGCYGDQSSFLEEELQALDAEGRTVITEFKYRNKDGLLSDLVIINVYCPRADHENPERIDFKLRFYRVLQLRAEALLQAGKSVIIVGDVNASHRRIDHCDPSDDRGDFENHPSRRWLDGFIKDVHLPSVTEDETSSSSSQGQSLSQEEVSSQEMLSSQDEPTTQGEQLSHEDIISPCSNLEDEEEVRDRDLQESGFSEGDEGLVVRRERHFVDTFRCFHPRRRNAFTCWCQMTGARQTNYGTRIDYIIADEKLCVNEFAECDIMPEVHGSDHCPVRATLHGDCAAAEQVPPLCAGLMPEFAGKQRKLSSFFQKVSPSKKFGIPEKAIGNDHQKNIHGSSSHATKRPGQPLVGKPSKKAKSSSTSSKKGNIASFFQKKSTTNSKQSMLQENTSLKEHCDISTDSSSVVNVLSTHIQPQDHCFSLNDESLMKTDLTCANSTTFPTDGVNSGALPDRTPSSTPAGDCQSKAPKPRSQLAPQWRNILKGPPPAPPCRGHKEPCVLRTVKKEGPNMGRQFFVCRRPEGHKNNPEARCNHFEWVPKR